MIPTRTGRGVDPIASEVTRYARLGHARAVVGWRRARIALSPSPRPLDAERAISDLPESPHVLVLCLGNICRSPFARRYTEREANQNGIDGLTVEAAGFIETEGRPSPDVAADVAREFGVDLEDHRSTLVTEDQLDRCDLVLVMDAKNLADLERRYGQYSDRSYFLKAFAGDGYEISDPFRGDVDEYREVFREMTVALDAFLAHLEEGGDG